MIVARLFIITISLLISFLSTLFAEVVYLKDGQVINGSIISETKDLVKIKGKYKNYEFKRSEILRILYGSRDLEKVYIQLKDNTLIQGFMVDQDNKKVILRRRKDSPEEETIVKSNVKQISNEKIILLFPEISVRTGMFMPLNTKDGANLDSALIVLGGFGIRLPFLSRSRVQFEAGYVKNTSTYTDFAGSERELYLYSIPLLFNYLYTYNLDELIRGTGGSKSSGPVSGSNFVNTFLKKSYLVGKLGVGMSYLIFNNGEDEKYSGLFFSTIAGVGYSYEVIEHTFFVQLASDFLFIIDSGAVLVPFIYSISLNYRY